MGLGLAFQKKEGASIDPSKIEKTFILENKGISNKIAELFYLKQTKCTAILRCN